MNEQHQQVSTRNRLQPISDARVYRLRMGVTLMLAAVHAGMSLARASTIERFPDCARRGELERLRQAIDTVAAQRAGAMEIAR